MGLKPTRRGLLGASLVALNACARREPTDGRVHLSFTSWGDGSEWRAFQRIVARYEAVRPEVRIHLGRVAYQNADVVDRSLAAGVGPDLLRVSFTDLGRYTPSGALIDLTPHLPTNLATQFSPQLWGAVLHRGVPRALPLHTDTSALLCNRVLFDRAGIPLPQTLADAWTWDQFTDIARSLQRQKLAPYGFGMNWTFAGAFRWLNFLYQRGGRLLQEDLRTPAIPSREAADTLTWTAKWFRAGLVPASTATKTGESVHQLWVSGVIGMQFNVGVTELQLFPPSFPYTATFLPRDRATACELGGTSVGITRDCRHPREAADFLLFLTNEANMREFCLESQFLPARRALAGSGLEFSFRPDVMRIFTEQATVLPEHLARTVTLPGFNRINRRLADELNLCFTGGQPVDNTLEHLAGEVRRAIA